MKKIKIAIAGLGNCASSLIQGIHYYGPPLKNEIFGLMHQKIGGYGPGDIRVVAAFDIDARKVGRDVNRAIFAPPNCTKVFCPDLPESGVIVKMGNILDGMAKHMEAYPEHQRFVCADLPRPDVREVAAHLKKSRADILLCYVPVGAKKAAEFYARCALEAETAFINNMPVFIASDENWAARFEKKGLVLMGDDIKSQMGATIVHRVLTDLFRKRGVKLERTYQLNTGGNTDFLNMLSRDRLALKKISKTEAVQSVAGTRLDPENIHIGPSDWVAWQKDNKVCFLRMEGKLFGEIPMDLELRLSVEDSPNSAGVAIDAVRCAKLAMDRGRKGVLTGPSAFFFKHPPVQMTDDQAHLKTEQFINAGVKDAATPS